MPRFLGNGKTVTSPAVGEAVARRVDELVASQTAELHVRDRIRRIMDGGDGAVAALLGDSWAQAVDGMPVANLMLSGMTRLAQKLGRAPDVKIDPPVTKDTDAARKRAERRERIIESFDSDTKLHMKLPQLGRWLPGYGFAVVTIDQRWNSVGDPYPAVELRDPFETFVGEWGVEQQPADVAFLRLIDRQTLADQYPPYRDKILASTGRDRRSMGMLPGSSSANARWASRGRDVVEVYEYRNVEGNWWVMPEAGLVLNFVPSPLKDRPLFYAMKRFSFSKLTSQYEHAIGLMAAMARMNLLTIVAAEDSVMAETNIIGEIIGEDYHKGRDAVNFFTPGSQVQKMNQQVPFQVLQQADRLERQLRLVEAYPVTDDSISPNSFVTGRGLDELTSAVDREVREYFTVLADMHTEIDSIRLEFAEKVYGGRLVSMYGIRGGAPFSETYRPAAAIKGDYRTRRVYGAMAGFDEPTKIITGLQLLQGEIIDTDTLREQIDGLENHTKIKERIRAEKSERLMFQMVESLAGQGDPKAMALMAELMPDGSIKTKLMELFNPEPSPEEEAAAQAQQAGLPGAGAPPPDTATVLSRLTAGNSGVTPTAGVQTVGQL